MAKTKHLKYERVRHLPNVFMPENDAEGGALPWISGAMAGRGIILELGCGKGEHARALALAHPDRVVVGVDIKSHRLCTGGEDALDLGLANLFFLRTDVGSLERWFEAGSVREIWITFPDPHPKQREIKHRLTAPGFMAAYSGLLLPGGRVYVKTDSDLFFDYTVGMVEDWGGAVEVLSRDLYGESGVPQGTAGVCSAFEKKARERGKTINYLRFTLT